MKKSKLLATNEDYLRLDEAVEEFNRKVILMGKLENKAGLPELIDSDDLRQQIVKKAELNKYIENLERFSSKNAERVTLDSGELITKWEKSTLLKEQNIALKNIEKQLEKTNPYDKDNVERLQATIKNIKGFENLTKGNLKDTIERIHRVGRSDYEYRRALTFRENYYKSLETYQNFEFYELWKKRLDEFTDPIAFYNFISKSEEMIDLFVYYKGGEGLVIRSICL